MPPMKKSKTELSKSLEGVAICDTWFRSDWPSKANAIRIAVFNRRYHTRNRAEATSQVKDRFLDLRFYLKKKDTMNAVCFRR